MKADATVTELEYFFEYYTTVWQVVSIPAQYYFLLWVRDQSLSCISWIFI
jgi:hypothetical protein